MGGLSSVSILKRLKRMEKAFGADDGDGWTRILMWGAHDAGVFGHVHMRISKFDGHAEYTPCTEKEELTLMRDEYERCEHKMYGKGDPMPFSFFLESYSFLGPAELEPRRREIIERLRSEENAE